MRKAFFSCVVLVLAGLLLAFGTVPAPAGASAQAATADFDVVVYSTQTSGLAAVRELVLGAPQLRVALISCGNLLESPLAQGLCIEDARNIEKVKGGFYDEWRNLVIGSYRDKGLKPYTASGRLAYEPEAAQKALWQFAKGTKSGGTKFYSAKLLAASDQGEDRYVDIQLEGGGTLRLRSKYFVDASVEGDLARMLGADYRVGRGEAVYNDVLSPRPAYPSAADDFSTAPQRLSALLTLKVYSKTAPRIASLINANYDPGSYRSFPPMAQKNVDAFKTGWSMTVATLPNAKRELNETWTDWPDQSLAFQWVFSPEKRGEIRKQVLQWTINRARYLQEHGYSRVGIATVPQKLYVREGPRIVGLDTYTVQELRSGTTRQPVALGCYVEYDRHDWFFPNHVEQTRYAKLPMGALMAKDHPWLLVSTAVSTDSAAYCSAVRMEHMRGAMGGAVGVIIVMAEKLGVRPDAVPYPAVRSELISRGYRLEPRS